jgi:prepilin-type N-terminal cleavage/methylation domain-containing protein/prepilin-type processing-associated H-X9-DG protein
LDIELKTHFYGKLIMKLKKGFTLIELLVVIAIIGLLLAILVPGLKKAKEKASNVICKSNLHQWGVLFQMYLNDNKGKFMQGEEEDFVTGRCSWIVTLQPYHNTPEIRFCPAANRTAAEGAVGPKAAWDMTPEINAGQLSMLHDSLYKTGSYGINWWVYSMTAAEQSQGGVNNKWGKIEKNASRLPVLMDCGFILARPLASNEPPEEDGQFAFVVAGGNEMRRVCTDRHNFKVNILYMDWSSGEVGLKELWKQEWHRNYVPRAVEPVWPDWMKSAK